MGSNSVVVTRQTRLLKSVVRFPLDQTVLYIQLINDPYLINYIVAALIGAGGLSVWLTHFDNY